jgi:hypothetical protein
MNPLDDRLNANIPNGSGFALNVNGSYNPNIVRPIALR